MGTGFGIIPLLISQRKEGAKIIGVEIQKDLVRLAEENLKLNGVHENITIIEGDFRNLKNRFKEGEFDWVLSNPPYMEPSAGRISPCEERAFARHEFHGDMKQLVTASAYFVSNTGRVSFIYPIRRFVQLLFCLKTAGLNPQRVRFVHPFEDSAAELFIIEARKGGKDSLKVEKPIILGETNLDEIIADNV
jgi:tRNA1Val (adenine37-N6)-methyltransferase